MSDSDADRTQRAGVESKEDGELSELLKSTGTAGVPMVDAEMAQKAAMEFKTMLQQLVEVQKKVVASMKQQLAGPATVAARAAGLSDAPGVGSVVGGEKHPQQTTLADDEKAPTSAEEAAFAETLLVNLEGLATQATRVTEARTEEDFLAAMNEMYQSEAYRKEFLPFLQGLMSSLLSKEMMYPTLVELGKKYPDWMETNKATVAAEDMERYRAQLALIQEATAEYERETPTDSEEVKAERFEKMILVMQKMQLYGHPPEELVGSLPPGWALGQSGLPLVTDSTAVADSCTIS